MLLMSMLNRLLIAFKAMTELGLDPLFQMGCYRLGLLTGLWKRLTPAQTNSKKKTYPIKSLLLLPTQDQLQEVIGSQKEELIKESNEIIQGYIRLFGGSSVEINLVPQGKLSHWTEFGRQGESKGEDIKFTWEPARFGWAFLLGRVYILTADEKYPNTFWKYTEIFLKGNPTNLGPNWYSAQEVSLRLLAIIFALQVFSNSASSTPERTQLLKLAIINHAARIPPTLSYARAQNNNHLVIEALGLFAAGLTMPDHPLAKKWRSTGWYWLNRSLQTQISDDGTYAQHSTNYHRLMLQAALWADTLGRQNSLPLPIETRNKLAAATKWLMAHFDSASGQVSNLGHNDGAYILPLAAGGFSDYRPVIQAANRVFLDKPCLTKGPWDEFGLWLGLPIKPEITEPILNLSFSPHRIGNTHSWANLRAEKFTSRPAHADQLHIDLWWKGCNVAMNPGTYSYNLEFPWNNSLSQTAVHNTVMVDGKDQMLRSPATSRFLWLDWAQAVVLEKTENKISAEHNGYRKLGVIHRRTLQQLENNRWQVIDTLFSSKKMTKSNYHSATLHWLLPNWLWDYTGKEFKMSAPCGTIRLELQALNCDNMIQPVQIQIIKAGKVIFGKEESLPIFGWFSSTYGLKEPAISIRMTVEGLLPLTFTSLWLLGDIQASSR